MFLYTIKEYIYKRLAVSIAYTVTCDKWRCLSNL